MFTPNALELRVELQGTDPPIWRHLLVPAAAYLSELHLILQGAMGWADSHLHRFEVGGLTYGDPALLDSDKSEGDALTFNAGDVRLSDFSRKPGLSFFYIYDFGDNWVHKIAIEKWKSLDPLPRYPTCIGGERACPPEDVGGTDGYREFLEIYSSADRFDQEERARLRRWAGRSFDPEKFDAGRATKAIQRALRNPTEGLYRC